MSLYRQRLPRLPIAGGVYFLARGLFGVYPVSPPWFLSRLNVCKLFERQSACVGELARYPGDGAGAGRL